MVKTLLLGDRNQGHASLLPDWWATARKFGRRLRPESHQPADRYLRLYGAPLRKHVAPQFHVRLPTQDVGRVGGHELPVNERRTRELAEKADVIRIPVAHRLDEHHVTRCRP